MWSHTAIEQWRKSASRVLAIPDIVLEAYGKATLETIELFIGKQADSA